MFEDAKEILDVAEQTWPKSFVGCLDQNSAGIGCVMRYLYEENTPVTAGAISKFMGVSTARVAVLLRTLEEKGMIDRDRDEKDSRKTLISISSRGKEMYEDAELNLLRLIDAVIQEMGKEQLMSFLQLSAKLEASMLKIKDEKPELYNLKNW